MNNKLKRLDDLIQLENKLKTEDKFYDKKECNVGFFNGTY